MSGAEALGLRQAQPERAGGGANPVRGEASLVVAGAAVKLRPTFSALVAAEEELGPLFALVERAASGGLALRELVALMWHCVDGPEGLSRETLGDAVVELGLAAVTPVLKVLLRQILQGR
ncbi:gene transfer agent family protein [Sphingomonas sp. ID0503]|uniref:gene transfer agent family protein n=1 Tax=Sphingomonas sp. ID0503 TaxID=3399691 RepID=UPI003AFA940E